MFLRSLLRSQNDVLMGKIRFTTIGSLLWEPILRITTIKTADSRVFKMAASCSKWLPAVFLEGFLASKAAKMAAPMEDLCWTVSYSVHWNTLNGFQCVSMGFFISLYDVFALQRFRWNKLTSLREAPLCTASQ